MTKWEAGNLIRAYRKSLRAWYIDQTNEEKLKRAVAFQLACRNVLRYYPWDVETLKRLACMYLQVFLQIIFFG